MSLGFSQPWLLLLLPLLLLPWLRQGQSPVSVPSLDLVPCDRLSSLTDVLISLAASLAVAALVCAISGPYRPAETVTRTGQGAQIILLLDRSRSMDQPFHSKENLRDPVLAQPAHRMKSKGSVARRVLSDFVTARTNDRFGVLVFSTRPMEVLRLTDKQPLVLAAIEAGGVGRGLAETNIGIGLIHAMAYFEDQPYTGSRIIVLISDGAAELSISDRHRIESMLERNRLSLYWIYIRSHYGVELFADAGSDALAPQQAWHRFFSELETPYRVYTAENPADLERAIDDVGRLQNMPILYDDQIPRRDLAQPFYLLAAVLLALLTLVRGFEVHAWR